MYDDILEFKGKEPGPTSMILVGVHGNEPCGVDALTRILPSLVIECGRVLIGYGNPRAISQNIRSTDSDLNRMFRPEETIPDSDKRGYEYARSQFLKKYLDQADVLLDIHSSSIPESPRFVICERNSLEISRYLPTDRIVFGFDAVQPGGTDYYMNRTGKIGICLECAATEESSITDTAEEGIRAFLALRGHVKAKKLLTKYEGQYLSVYRMYLTATNSFKLAKEFKDFEKVAKGQLLGIDGSQPIYADQDSYILFAQSSTIIGDEAFLLARE